jgi:hypothetical protein
MPHSQDLDILFSRLWQDYSKLNPIASRIYGLLTARGEKILNDHVAFRTIRHPKIGLSRLMAPFLAQGYAQKDEYFFVEKKLYARHLEHADPTMPKVFVSELKVEEFPKDFQYQVMGLLEQVPADWANRPDFLWSGRPWKSSFALYESLSKTSEYAAWMTAFGFRTNHFTVSLNALKTFSGLPELNSFLKSNGIALNTSGGEIKGSKEVFLEQSSTLADRVRIDFTDGFHTVPACYYEFAKRYPMPNGELYQGFVEESADKIFESTDRGGDRR